MLGSGNAAITASLHSGVPPLVSQALKAIAATIRHTKGNVALTARKLKVGRTTLNRWIVEYPELKEAVMEARGRR